MVVDEIRAAAEETYPEAGYFVSYDENYPATNAGQRLLGSASEQLPEIALACLREAARHSDGAWSSLEQAYACAGWQIAGRIFRRKVQWGEDELSSALATMLEGASHGRLMTGWTPIVPAVGAVEKHLDGRPPGAQLARELRRVRSSLYHDADGRRLAARIDVVLGDAAPSAGELGPDDPWRAAILDAIVGLGDGAEEARALIAVAGKAGASNKASKAFKVARGETVATLGQDRTGVLLAALLQAAAQVPPKAEFGQVPPPTGDLLRGLAWIGSATAGVHSAAALARLAVGGWRKVPGAGPQCRKAASAALVALGEHPDGPAQLGAVKVQLKQPAARAEADAAIDAAAERLGVSREDLEERLVPNFGLTAGEWSGQLGAHTARLSLDARLRFELVFSNASGRQLKSVPAEVKRDHSDRLVELKALRKDAQQMLDAQRLRLERLLMNNPSWPVGDWRERYVDHDLLGPLARRLIWTFDDQRAATWFDGAWRAADSSEIDIDAFARVRLWHPAGASPTDVLAWREALEDWQMLQPFKQAHREVYLLTQAELATDVYSNRFAGNIIRQHQFAALARNRGWRYALQGAWDAPDEQAVLPLPAHDLEACFWVDRPWGAEDDWNDSGVFNHVLTDQVRFVTSTGEAVALSDVPPLVFSEALRDVDLFVGVASIGNDPNWQDSEGARRDTWGGYWADYSFGDLSAAAEIRRDVLERLIPKLTIREVAELDERFLRVRGSLRTYKIHLGSGNILMEPNDQYLCIVPGRKDGDAHTIMLPFEGDQLLSIILSKALLLADDDKITDRTMLSQIRRR